MGKTTQQITAGEITSIISGVMASMESRSAVMVNDSNTSIQLIENSENCKNRKITFSRDTYVSNGTVFMSDLAVQTMYANVMNDIAVQLESVQEGASVGKTNQELAAIIQNTLVTVLTQQAITSYVSSIINTDTSIQVCYGSEDSGNYIFGSSRDIYNFYYEQYTKMGQVQQVSADISNTLEAEFSAKQTGILAMLTKAITVICIVIIIVVAIVVMIIVFGMIV